MTLPLRCFDSAQQPASKSFLTTYFSLVPNGLILLKNKILFDLFLLQVSLIAQTPAKGNKMKNFDFSQVFSI
jgi:hypothetical protein